VREFILEIRDTITNKAEIMEIKTKTRNKKSLTGRDIATALKAHSSILRKYKVRKIGLFGSYFRGDTTGRSDIDLLVEFKEPTFDNFMGLLFYLENLFGKKVDLITTKGLSPYIRPFVEKEIEWHEA